MEAVDQTGATFTESPTGDWQAGDWVDVIAVPVAGHVVVRFTPTLYEDPAWVSYCDVSCESFAYFGASGTAIRR